MIEGRRAFQEVEEQYAVVARDVAQFDFEEEEDFTYGSYATSLVAASWHDWATRLLDYLIAFVSEVIESPMAFAPDYNDGKMCASDMEPFITESFRRHPEVTRGVFLFMSNRSRERIMSHLKQEACRTWKRFYPQDAEYKTVGEAMFPQELPSVDSLCSPRRKSQAFRRDQLWLRWHEKEGLTPAAIRDRWDGLSDEKRKRICAAHWRKIGGSSSERKKAGRESVKTGLTKAKKERELGSRSDSETSEIVKAAMEKVKINWES